jgi:hypothetical protein
MKNTFKAIKLILPLPIEAPGFSIPLLPYGQLLPTFSER